MIDNPSHDFNWPLGFNEHQAKCLEYHFCKAGPEAEKTVHILGLAGEAGEIVEKYKKSIRDGTELNKEDIAKEISDVLFYCAAVAGDIGYTMEAIARIGLAKLADRQARGVMSGSGDNR